MAAHVKSPSSVAQLADSHPTDATDRILQEITAVGWRLEAMDLKISDLSAASTSIRADIAYFQVMVTDLDQTLTTVEDHIVDLLALDVEIRSLQVKITDLEDRSRRDNVRFFDISEHKEGSDIKAFLKNFLPELTGRWSFKAPTEWVLYIKKTLDNLAPSSHASSATSRPAKSSQRPDLRVRSF
ncbi:hypothetical protein NDU88_007030 [Pleurodeles waltl]|uniref:Uncharacterized protein n=1 Tax=Pleurodeles waltl TaxID=8319 RepID=A0AAV7NZS1_PLEWA|nr:hypothetical protein NDU88_007030 [Pleurodeles waltl]